ncbi:MAG: hypothetical protein Q9187_006223, partial [Circinaria calcarea]
MARTVSRHSKDAEGAVVDCELGGVARKRRTDELWERWDRHMAAQVCRGRADVLMILCCLVAGLTDSTVYNAFSTFVSMQTDLSSGNTIFLGLGASFKDSTKPFAWAKSLASIACFLLGAFCFSRFCRYLGPLRRKTMVLSFLIQSSMVILTAALVQADIVDGTVQAVVVGIRWREMIPITILSFQAAGQIVGSRDLDLHEIPTVVVTTVICDFGMDPRLFSSLKSNAVRNRRFFAFTAMLIGALVGGRIAKSTGGIEIALWISGGIKLVITGCWLFWPEDSS